MELGPAEHKIQRRAMGAVRSGRIKTFFTLITVGALTGGLGLFMFALEVFDLDREFEAAPFHTHVLLWIIAGLFLLLGVGMGIMALVGLGGRGRRAHLLLFEHPQEIAGAWRQVSTKQGTRVSDNEGAFGSHALVLETRDQKTITVMMNALQVTLCLRWIAIAAPNARGAPQG